MSKLFEIVLRDEEGIVFFLQYTNIDPEKTQTDFKNDISTLLQEYGNHYLDDRLNDKTFATTYDWLIGALEDIEELGYREVKPYQLIINDENIVGFHDSEDKTFSKLVGHDLYKKATENNKIIKQI